jgi:valyl-tRNA synthetase
VPHQMTVGPCDRCGTVSEPRLSTQWFIRTGPLAAEALAAVRDGRTRIVPQRFEKVYAHWMENIHDWAVGRQLWWGHRIPAWFCPDGHITVSDREEGPDACAECGRPARQLTQETDIFDTWFSSGLWPFSTLGWPDDTADYRRFYPTSVLETGYDIIFFWVARMMMLGIFCTGQVPFHTVYLHGLVRAGGGVKMSKTKGNVVDPLEMIEDVGADALRYALIAGTSAGNDQRLTRGKLERGRNFANKLWNAARFLIASRPASLEALGATGRGQETLPERWIRSRAAAAIESATRSLDAFDLGAYAGAVYDFAWSDYCDWFLEAAKVELRRPGATEEARARTWSTAASVFADLLRLLHPIMPFVSEATWEPLRAAVGCDAPALLLTAPWPQSGDRDPDAEDAFADLEALVREVRNLRTQARVPAGEWVPVTVATDEAAAERMSAVSPYVESLARVRPLTPGAEGEPRPDTVAATPFGAAWLGRERGPNAALSEQRREYLARGIERLRQLLASEFVAKAPAEVVERERARLAQLEEQLRQLGAGEGR